MQFTAANDGPETEIVHVLNQFPKYGYDKPKIIFWNTAGYAGSPETCYASNTALVSGFSPSILKSIFQGDDLSPISVMMRTLEKYEIKVP
jgi:hypothetical protein